MTIKSKVHNYGHEHESDWPPMFPQDTSGGSFYWDKETQTFKEGYPPNPNNKFGVAPTVIFDSMPPTYHEGACRTVESRAEWERLDKETGSLTFSSTEEPKKHIAIKTKEEKKALREDRRNASLEAIRKVRANPREINQKFQKEAEKQAEIAKQSGLDKILKGVI